MGLLSFNTLFTQTNLSQVLNVYAAVEAIDPCENTLTLNDLSSFEAGMDILIIQMQGASIDLDNNSGFGNITDLGSAGLYEKNQIASLNGNTVVLSFQVQNTYDLAGNVQIVSFPKYEDAVVVDTVKGLPWNGSIGGIVALQVADSLRLEAPISANGIGFRGGISAITVNNNCNFATSANNYFYGTDNWRGASKGEGIARFTPGAENGRGPQGNGGGGGNDHNAGGGGGSNLTKAGQGGTNEEPSFFGCDGNFPGFGGREILSDSTRLFLGGGGGAGHENNDVGTDGGNGGGIIVLSVGTLINNDFLLEAKGETPEEGGGDGGGGGGGGGSILLLYDQASPIALTTSGGDGGSINNGNAGRCQGPGGAGSGGHVLTNGLLADPNVHASGGIAGLTFDSSECGDGNNGAEDGAAGVITPISTLIAADQAFGVPAVLEQPTALSLCEGSPLTIGVLTQGAQLTFQWQADQGAGFSPLQDDANFSGVNTDSLQIQTETLDVNGWQFQLQINSDCGASFSSDPILVTVLPAPIPSFGSMLDGQTVTFDNTSTEATTYNWDFGDGNNSAAENPVHNYAQTGTFTVTLTATNDCGTEQTTNTITIAGAPNAAFSANPETGCTPMTVNFSNDSSGEISSLAWRFPGGTPAFSTENDPSITYNNPGSFDVTLVVTNAAGVDSVVLTNYIQVGELPVADFNFTINELSVSLNNASTNADNIEWNVPALDQSSDQNEVSFTFPEAGTYLVQLTATNACGSIIKEESITIAGAPNAAFSANPENGCTPMTVNFSNDSSGEISSVAWLFPGGTPAFSAEKDPSITYNIPGSFDVTLIVTYANGVDSVRLADYIQVGEAPVADFNFSIDLLDLTLNNASSNADDIEWYIPALDQNSNMEEVTFTFPEAGTYVVQLTATNACGSITKEESITIGQAPNANFSLIPTGACEQASIIFTNQSTGSIENYNWEFPGGMPATSTAANPTVFYENAGLYTVKLTVSGPLGEAEIIREGAVEVLLRPNPNFSYIIDGLSVSFQNTSSDASRYNWAFGDGNSSNELNPTHVYSQPGLYDVSLNAQNQYCGLAASQAVFLKPNAVGDIENESLWLAYPNPFQDEIFLKHQGIKSLAETTFQVYSDIGQLLKSGQFQQQTTISTPGFSSGIYWIKLTTADKVSWQKVLKTE